MKCFEPYEGQLGHNINYYYREKNVRDHDIMRTVRSEMSRVNISKYTRGNGNRQEIVCFFVDWCSYKLVGMQSCSVFRASLYTFMVRQQRILNTTVSQQVFCSPSGYSQSTAAGWFSSINAGIKPTQHLNFAEETIL